MGQMMKAPKCALLDNASIKNHMLSKLAQCCICMPLLFRDGYHPWGDAIAESLQYFQKPITMQDIDDLQAYVQSRACMWHQESGYTVRVTSRLKSRVGARQCFWPMLTGHVGQARETPHSFMVVTAFPPGLTNAQKRLLFHSALEMPSMFF
eukprot:1161882-Pelagomonas_calceolata.AAC.9